MELHLHVHLTDHASEHRVRALVRWLDQRDDSETARRIRGAADKIDGIAQPPAAGTSPTDDPCPEPDHGT